MNLTLGIIVDGLSDYKPIVHKINKKSTEIHGFQYYSADIAKTEPDCLYVVSLSKTTKAFGENCPKHLIVLGKVPNILPENTVTLIQIPGSVPAEAVIQTGNALFAACDTWHNSLLMAIINHKPIDAFLNIAAKMLANPILVMNNNLSIISAAGSITCPTKGTIWEKVNVPGFVLDNFYSPEEIRKISMHIAQKNEQIISLNPKNDPAHFTLGIHIWIDGKLCGAIGTVDMNEPFTEGQKETLVIIAKVLKLYLQNHSIYMQIAEDKANWINSLLDGSPVNGVEISPEIISSYLNRFQWKLDDYFRIVTFSTCAGLKIPIISILDIKHINELFPDALISVYEENVVMILRCEGNQHLNENKKQQLETVMKKDIMLCCGVSMVFNNFLQLRYYYTQSKFAAAQCKPSLNLAICFYEDYHADHVLQILSRGDDPRCFCHPVILSLWESGSESQRDLVHCLYHYFINGKNISASAEALHVHRNTLIYRLSKAEELLNIDLKQPSEKQTFFFIISCMIVQRL